jgi:hypothetical protein
MPLVISADCDARPQLALYFARKIAALDAKSPNERHPCPARRIRLSYCEHIAAHLGLERVSVPRLRPGSIKLKQGGG